MKRIIPLLLFFCLLFTSCNGGKLEENTVSSDTVTEAETNAELPVNRSVLNVMSFNIWGGGNWALETYDDYKKPIDGTLATRGAKLNALLNGEGIDVAGLQEIPAITKAWLRDELDEKYSFIENRFDESRENVVIYRKDKFTVVDYGAFCLAKGAPQTSVIGWDADCIRDCVWVLFQVTETSEYFMFMTTHLDHIGNVARKQSASLIVGQMEELKQTVQTTYGIEDCPMILTGDMNSEPDSSVYATFTASLNDARVKAEGKTLNSLYSTGPGFKYYESVYDYIINGHTIDYIFLSKNVVSVSYKMIHTASNLCPYGEYISDHNAVIAEIQLP
ncbi:MAG: endonuclease/exonuclease/phosphatase family protein [Clostridia bacterium]|nr:endonuclease/exonuclease/phosphatase family protein [Clostridia bacterium]